MMKITNLDMIKKAALQMEGAKAVFKQIPISKNDGSPNFSFRAFTIKKNGHTPYHQHPFEHLNYVIEGEGAIVNKSGEKHAIRQGDFAFIQPDEKHQFRNTSETNPLVIICAVPVEHE
jgi:quercetin dioxygenase-like cupin family protein